MSFTPIVKIYGAGSIGNHLAQACRRKGWKVYMVDNDQTALDRMRNDIYPSRYGKWDEYINLFASGEEPFGIFDVVFVGTPPDVRLDIAFDVLERDKPKVLQLEKPPCPPSDLGRLKELAARAKKSGVTCVVGYNHAVSKSIKYVKSLLEQEVIGEVLTIDVEFREHWSGIFSAHPWLKSPSDSYLGFTKRGGGALGEHSHAIHLWLYLARVSGIGSVIDVNAFSYIRPAARYDELSAINLYTSFGKVGRVVQDVIAKPPVKRARLQGENGYIEWHCESGKDTVTWRGEGEEDTKVFSKTRPDDFYEEILHIEEILKKKIDGNEDNIDPLSLSLGIEVVEIMEEVRKRG